MEQTTDDVRPLHRQANQTRRGAAILVREDEGTPSEPGEPDTDAIAATIGETIAELSHTLDAIRRKLSPESLVRQAGDWVQHKAVRRIEDMETNLSEISGRIGHGTVKTFRNNPVPLALLGLGLGWLALHSLRGSTDGYQESGAGTVNPQMDSEETDALSQSGVEDLYASEYREGGAYGSQGRMRKAVQKAKRAAGSVKQKASHLSETVKQRPHVPRERVSHLMEERPLALGMAGIAIGAMLGLAFAGALTKRGVLSGTGESLRHKAREVVEDAREKAARIAGEARRAAREEAERQQVITH